MLQSLQTAALTTELSLAALSAEDPQRSFGRSAVKQTTNNLTAYKMVSNESINQTYILFYAHVLPGLENRD
jgi:hypothetical protein